jgi:catechol 2,3-dioxygenase-like lactoylglutathione lyase family enzyme
MKISSISGVELTVEDLDRATAFYESLGFRPGKREDGQATCYVNWFWVRLVETGTAVAPHDASSLHMKVDDIDEFHAGVRALGLEPESEPCKHHSGREFRLRDPDGHELAFFGK